MKRHGPYILATVLALLCGMLLASVIPGRVPPRLIDAAILDEPESPSGFMPGVETSLGAVGQVTALAEDGDTLYAGGTFERAGKVSMKLGLVDKTTSEAQMPFNHPLEYATPGFVFNPRTTISDGDGGWYVGGEGSGAFFLNSLFHILDDGTLDPDFNPDVLGDVFSLVLDGTTLYVGGAYLSAGGTGPASLAAIDVTTGTATSFNPSLGCSFFICTVNSLALDGTTLYIGGGNITGIGGALRNNLGAVDTTTGLATPFDPDVDDFVFEILLDGGTLYAGGDFTTVNGGTTRNRLAAFDAATGSASVAFDPDVDSRIYALALDGTTLYAGGFFGTVNGIIPRSNLASFDTTTGIVDPLFDPSMDSSVYDLLFDGTTLYAAGLFSTVNGITPRGGVAGLDPLTGVATPFEPAVGNRISGGRYVFALADDGGDLFIAGAFRLINTLPRNNLAAFDLATGGVTAMDPDVNAGVSAFILDGTTLYAGGGFTTVNGGVTRNRLAAFDTATGLATPFDPNMNSSVFVLELDGTTLYAGGFFTTVNGGTGRRFLAAFDTTVPTVNVTAFNPDLDSVVSALALDGTTLYAGGSFGFVNGGCNPVCGTSRTRLAAFDTTTGIATPFNPSLLTGVATSLALDGTTLYVGGSFTTVNGGTTRNRLAAFDTATSIATAFDPNLDAVVRTIALDGTTLYAGGEFTTVNGGPTRNRLAAFDTTTGVATAFDPDMDASVRALTLGSLFAGGDFATADGGQTGLNALVIFPDDGVPPPTPTPTQGGSNQSGSGFLPSTTPSPSASASVAPSPTPTLTPTLTPTPTQIAAVTPTATPFRTPTPSPTTSASATPTTSASPRPEPSAGDDAIIRATRTLVEIAPEAAPAIVVATAIPLLVALAAAVASGTAGAFSLFVVQSLLEVFGIKKRPHVWGTVYDARTKHPISYARVELRDPSGRILEARYADQDGRYGFLTSPASLHQATVQVAMTPSAKGYAFPSALVTTDPDFLVYEHVYKGGTIEIREDNLVNYNIPMDPRGAAAAAESSRPWGALSKLTSTLLDAAFWIGLVVVPLNAILNPSLFTIGLLVVFVLVNATRIAAKLRRPYGLVRDSRTGAPVPYALVTLNDLDGRRLAFAVSDNKGRYFLLSRPGSYLLTAHPPAHLQSSKTNARLIDTRRGWISEEILLVP